MYCSVRLYSRHQGITTDQDMLILERRHCKDKSPECPKPIDQGQETAMSRYLTVAAEIAPKFSRVVPFEFSSRRLAAPTPPHLPQFSDLLRGGWG